MGKMTQATHENVRDVEDGARVKLKDGYGSGTKYFICHLSPGFCMIADNKRACREGLGYIHSIYDIKSFEIFQ